MVGVSVGHCSFSQRRTMAQTRLKMAKALIFPIYVQKWYFLYIIFKIPVRFFISFHKKNLWLLPCKLVNGGKIRSHICLIYPTFTANVGESFGEKRMCNENCFGRHSPTKKARKKFFIWKLIKISFAIWWRREIL